MEIELEIRKSEAKNTFPEYHKKRVDSKLFYEIPLLMLTNQNKALFIILNNQNISIGHQNKEKFRNFP